MLLRRIDAVSVSAGSCDGVPEGRPWLCFAATIGGLIELAYPFRFLSKGIFMHAKITVAALLPVMAACVPLPVVLKQLTA